MGAALPLRSWDGGCLSLRARGALSLIIGEFSYSLAKLDRRLARFVGLQRDEFGHLAGELDVPLDQATHAHGPVIRHEDLVGIVRRHGHVDIGAVDEPFLNDALLHGHLDLSHGRLHGKVHRHAREGVRHLQVAGGLVRLAYFAEPLVRQELSHLPPFSSSNGLAGRSLDNIL